MMAHLGLVDCTYSSTPKLKCKSASGRLKVGNREAVDQIGECAVMGSPLGQMSWCLVSPEPSVIGAKVSSCLVSKFLRTEVV